MKILLKIFKWLGLSVLALLALVFLLLVLDRDSREVVWTAADKNNIQVVDQYEYPSDSSLYYQLFKTYGKSKNLAPGFELQCLIALSYYPELKEAPIDFVIQEAFLPLSSRPDPITILFPWVQRRYLVVISNASTNFFEPILLKNIPINEQIGVIGHELAHTVYYLDKSALFLAYLAYQYQNNDFIIDFERATDKRAIAHGLGPQMEDYAYFVRRRFGNTEEEIETEEGGAYLSPKEVRAEMKKYTFYE